MTKIYVYFLIAIFTIGSIFKLKCQTKISGKLSDIKDKPISEANVMIYPDVKGNLLGFTVTNESGTFEINLKTKLDSVYLQIEHLTFEPYFKKVSVTKFLKIQLSERSTRLPELIISHERIQKRGDTVFYDVGQFKKRDDVNIEDLLRRLPGVEISDDGAINYKGEAISRFYIEGMDMLEGRYKIASRGINLDAVSEVQILERHQHIRALKDLVIPANAAINIKLKSGTTYTATYEGGLGAQPLLYNAKGNLFGFSKKHQFNFIGASNNNGINNTNLFQSMTIVDQNQSVSGMLQVTKPITPKLRGELFRLNNEHVLGINFLKKLTQTLELKYNASIQKDKIRNFGGNNFSLYDGINTFKVLETIDNTIRTRAMDHSIKLESNKDKFFFTSRLKAAINPSQTNGTLNVNGNNITEMLLKSLLTLNGDISTIVRIKSKAYKIHSNIDYDNIQDSLTIQPTGFLLPEFGEVNIQKAVQIFNQQFLNSHTYTSFHSKKNQINYDFFTGFKTRNLWLNTGLSGITPQLKDQFINEVSNAWGSTYANQNVSFTKNKTSLTLDLPLSFQYFNINNKINSESVNNQFIVYNPSISLSRRIISEIQTNVSVGYGNNADNKQIYFNKYILTSNRILNRRLPQINQSQGWNFSNSNIFTGLFGLYDMLFLSFNWYSGSQNQVQSNTFDPSTVVTQLLSQKNSIQSFSSHGMFKTDAFSNKVLFELNYNIMVNWADQSFNNILRKTNTNIANVQSSIDYYPTTKFGIKSNINFAQFGSNFTPPSYTISYLNQAQYIPFKDVTMKLDLNLVLNTINKQSNLTSVFGVEISYKLNSKKLQFILQGTNLTNIINYQILKQTIFQLQESYYQIRPRQIFLSVRRWV